MMSHRSIHHVVSNTPRAVYTEIVTTEEINWTVTIDRTVSPTVVQLSNNSNEAIMTWVKGDAVPHTVLAPISRTLFFELGQTKDDQMGDICVELEICVDWSRRSIFKEQLGDGCDFLFGAGGRKMAVPSGPRQMYPPLLRELMADKEELEIEGYSYDEFNDYLIYLLTTYHMKDQQKQEFLDEFFVEEELTDIMKMHAFYSCNFNTEDMSDLQLKHDLEVPRIYDEAPVVEASDFDEEYRIYINKEELEEGEVEWREMGENTVKFSINNYNLSMQIYPKAGYNSYRRYTVSIEDDLIQYTAEREILAPVDVVNFNEFIEDIKEYINPNGSIGIILHVTDIEKPSLTDYVVMKDSNKQMNIKCGEHQFLIDTYDIEKRIGFFDLLRAFEVSAKKIKLNFDGDMMKKIFDIVIHGNTAVTVADLPALLKLAQQLYVPAVFKFVDMAMCKRTFSTSYGQFKDLIKKYPMLYRANEKAAVYEKLSSQAGQFVRMRR